MWESEGVPVCSGRASETVKYMCKGRPRSKSNEVASPKYTFATAVDGG